MKALIIATTVFSGVMVIPAFAADGDAGPQGPIQSIEQKKAEILKHIDRRIAHEQEEKACVQAATSHNDLKACRNKFRVDPKDNRQTRIP